MEKGENMRVFVLAGGKGTRVRSITHDRIPKPLVEVAGMPILTHIFRELPPVITEIVTVIGHKGEMIRDYFGNEFEGRAMRYVWQTQAGTYGALLSTEEYFDERSVVMYADDFIFRPDFDKLVRKPLAVLAARHKEPQNFGVISKTWDNKLLRIDEKPERPGSNLVNTGVYVLTPEIFNYGEYATRLGDELLLTPAVTAFAKDHPMDVVETKWWCPIGTPEAIPVAEQMLLDRQRLDL